MDTFKNRLRFVEHIRDNAPSVWYSNQEFQRIISDAQAMESMIHDDLIEFDPQVIRDTIAELEYVIQSVPSGYQEEKSGTGFKSVKREHERTLYQELVIQSPALFPNPMVGLNTMA